MKREIKALSRLMRLMIIVSGILMLSGCYRLKRELDFHSNGTVTVKIDVAVQEELIKASYDSIDAFYEDIEGEAFGGYIGNFDYERTKTTLNDSNAYGFIMQGTVPARMAGRIVSNGNFDVEINKSGLINKTILITLTSKKDTNDKEQNSYADYMTKSSSDEFIVKVPGKLLATNGFKDENDSRMVSWDISDIENGKTSSKELVVSYLDLTLIIIPLIAIAIIALIVTIIVLIVKRKKKKRDNMISVSI